MRTYRHVTEFEPTVGAFLAKHRDRLLAAEVPRGLWLCEEDGEPIIALLAYTDPAIRVSVIVDRPETRPFMALERLARMFEAWAVEVGVSSYFVIVPRADDYYCRILEKRGAVEVERTPDWVEYRQDLTRTVSYEDGVRPWNALDWQALRPLMRAFLAEHYAAGGDFPPTRGNVEAFIRRGVKAASQGDPALVLCQGGKLAAFCLWAGVDPLGLDMRERVCTGLGTFILPDLRRQGWSKKLRALALEVAKTKGYARVDGVALDKRGFDAGKAAGFTFRGALVTHRLES